MTIADSLRVLRQDIKQLEISDDEGEAECSAPSSAFCSETECGLPQAEPAYRVVWDSSASRKKPVESDSTYSTQDADLAAAEELKAKGNALYEAGNPAGALAIYAQAIDVCSSIDKRGESRDTANHSLVALLAALHSNAAAASLLLGRYADAAKAARQACSLRPDWTKPLHRLAEAQLKMYDFPAAVASCLKGEFLCNKNSCGHTEFTTLLNRIAVEAAIDAGSSVGFTGRQLEVRSAGEEAWLGRPAPHIPVLDGPLTEETALPSDDLSVASTMQGLTPDAVGNFLTDGRTTAERPIAENAFSKENANDALVSWTPSNDTLGAVQRQRTSFRCIKEAVAAARDGDRIILRRGVHNGMGETIDVTKRLLIEGEGSLGESVIDQRANTPTFRICCSGVVLRCLDFDHTGFREALLVNVPSGRDTGRKNTDGSWTDVLVDGCSVKCSGDDAINVAGQSSPLFRNCNITAKKCGVRASERAHVRLKDCLIEKCGTQGVSAMENSSISAIECVISQCEEEGALGTGSASVKLAGCVVRENKGPGVDCSETACVEVHGGVIERNVGGVWLWDQAIARMEGVRLDGGPSQVILADGQSKPDALACVIKGTVHATDNAWEGLLRRDGPGSNVFLDPDGPTDFPPEQGPFCFVPDKFTRKQ